ncbi:MAG: hypothetical protein OXN23_02565 [Gammaproteobacteria bacterium]|nr:hypothetical protein [Gammaproteobacteria bacterium]
MAVLLRVVVDLAGQEEEIKVYHPPGELSRENQKRAEDLDKFLTKEVPVSAERIIRLPNRTRSMWKWHLFGQELRRIVDGNELVLDRDLKEGYIWEAIKQHLPENFGLKGAGQARVRKSGTLLSSHRGHLPVCYAVAHYDWKDVSWIRRWTDWCAIYYRESMWKDHRVLVSLQKEIESMDTYPKGAEFREIIGNLAKETTKRDLEVLDDSTIVEKVHRAVVQAGLKRDESGSSERLMVQ